jgi:glycosyltransferase involved in cell wall biosynthesis
VAAAAGECGAGCQTVRIAEASENPEVTVVVPVWDAYVGPQLAAAIRSIADQDPPHHILLVDNASVNPLPAIDGARVLRLPRRVSVGAARNAGLEQVRTPWVVFWDADDLMLPGTLRALLSQAERDVTAVAVVARIVDGSTGGEYHWPRRWMKALASRPRAFARMHAVWCLFPTTGAALLRTDVVRDAGGFADADGGDDWALGLSIAFRGPVVFNDHRGRWYSQSSSSLSARWRAYPHILENAKVARDRMYRDSGLPLVDRMARPLVALTQMLIIVVLRPLLGRGRRRAETVSGDKKLQPELLGQASADADAPPPAARVRT